MKIFCIFAPPKWRGSSGGSSVGFITQRSRVQVPSSLQVCKTLQKQKLKKNFEIIQSSFFIQIFEIGFLWVRTQKTNLIY